MKFKCINQVFFSIGLVFILFACISEYNFHQSVSGELVVVEGFVTDKVGDQKILLSKSLTFNSYKKLNLIDNAIVFVTENEIDTIPYTFNGHHYEPVNKNFAGQVGKIYTLHFKIDERQYMSSGVTMQKTSEIKSINWQERDIFIAGDGQYKSVNFLVSTYENENTAHYNRYFMDETWLAWARLSRNIKYECNVIKDNNTRLFVEDNPVVYDNITFCWPNKVKNDIVLSSSSNLSVNKLTNEPVYDLLLQKEGHKLLFKYSLLLKQYGISDKTFHVLDIIREFTDGSGTLFVKQPGYVKGNVENIGNPDDKVLGVFYASQCKTKRIFCYFGDFSFEAKALIYDHLPKCEFLIVKMPIEFCPNPDKKLNEFAYKELKSIDSLLTIGYVMYNKVKTPIGWDYYFSNENCLDCRGMGPNIKPEWWGADFEPE